MKHLILILAILLSIGVSAQIRYPTGFPTQFNTGWNKWGYAMTDSGLIVANRDTTWLPKYSGTVVFRPANKKFYWFDSTDLSWNPFASEIDTTSLSNRIDLKLDISDTANLWWGIGKRWVDTMYRVNDSTIGYTINGAPYTFQILGRANGPSGPGTVTSVGLSMPSAFSVSGSPVTNAGTINVIGAGDVTDYIRGNGTLGVTDTGMIPDFYLKVRGLFSATSPITYNSVTGQFGIQNASTSGQKGAATFLNSDFSDNGAGLISLSTLISPGSCTHCALVLGADGRVQSYSSGTGPTGGAVDTLFRIPGIDSIYFTINSVQYAIKDSSGGGSGFSTNNVGGGYRWVATPGGNIKTVYPSPTITWDSTSNANGLTPKVDTTTIIATQWDIIAGRPNIQQVLNVGDTITSLQPIYRHVSDTSDNVVTFKYIPSNYSVVYPSHGVGGLFQAGWARFNGVNPNGRPNVVGNFFTYNSPMGGGQIIGTEASYRFAGETHYDFGAGDGFEFHLPEVFTRSGSPFRPFSMYISQITGKAQINYMATGGVSYQSVTGDDIFAFNENGGFSFYGRSGSATISLYDDSTTGTRYTINNTGTGISHESYGTPHFWDSQNSFSNNYNNSAPVVVSDSRNTNNVIALQMDLTSTNAKYPIRVFAAVNGGTNYYLENTTGTNELNVIGTGNARMTIRNSSPTDPAGGGYNAGFSEYVAGGENALIGMNYGTSAGPYVGTQLFYRTVGNHPHIWYTGSSEDMRLTGEGKLGIGTTTPTFGLHVNRSIGANKDSVSYLSSTGTRQMLVIDTSSGRFYRMDVPGAATTIYSGDGSLAGSRNITGGANTLTLSGTQGSVYEFNVNNTGNGGAASFTTTGTGTAIIGSNSSSGAGVTGTSVSGVGGNFTSTSSAGLRAKSTPSSTNTVFTTFRGIRGSSATAAIGMGNAWDMQLTDDAGNDITTTRFSTVFTDATTASPDAYFNILTITNGSLTNKFSIKNTGQLVWDNYTTSNFIAIDTTNYKPVVVDATGNIYRMSGWAATGGSSTTIYSGDGTVSGNRDVNVDNHNITFSDANLFKISADFFYQAKADGTRSYGAAIDPSSTGRQSWQFGYLPFLRGVGLYVDTLNNVGLGDATQTTMPLYNTGNSAFVRNGFQSQQGNFYAVTNVTTNTTLSLVANFVTVDATSGNVTITLPAASSAFGANMGLDMVFKRLDNSGNSVTIQRAGSDTIDGANNFTLTTQYEAKKLRAISTSTWGLY